MSTLTAVRDHAAFDGLAATYDEVFTESLIGKAQRACVWREVDRRFRPGQRVLEINCGTGVDALHLARRGVQVMACDASPAMIAQARRRIAEAELETHVEFRVLPTEQLGDLDAAPPFDGALSNFAGLNCVDDLAGVATQIARLVRPGAQFILCVFGRYCVWEMLWYLLAGKPRKAFRRLRRDGVLVKLGPSATVRVRYLSVRSWERLFAPHFRLKKWQGVGVVVPPSYLEPLAVRFRRAFRAATNLEAGLDGFPIARCLADHQLLTFERSKN